jgi:hypothetical protein
VGASGVAAVVELIKDDYLVVSLPDAGNAIGFVATKDFNQLGIDSHSRFSLGEKLLASVAVLPEPATGEARLLAPRALHLRPPGGPSKLSRGPVPVSFINLLLYFLQAKKEKGKDRTCQGSSGKPQQVSRSVKGWR